MNKIIRILIITRLTGTKIFEPKPNNFGSFQCFKIRFHIYLKFIKFSDMIVFQKINFFCILNILALLKIMKASIDEKPKIHSFFK